MKWLIHLCRIEEPINVQYFSVAWCEIWPIRTRHDQIRYGILPMTSWLDGGYPHDVTRVSMSFNTLLAPNRYRSWKGRYPTQQRYYVLLLTALEDFRLRGLACHVVYLLIWLKHHPHREFFRLICHFSIGSSICQLTPIIVLTISQSVVSTRPPVQIKNVYLVCWKQIALVYKDNLLPEEGPFWNSSRCRFKTDDCLINLPFCEMLL